MSDLGRVVVLAGGLSHERDVSLRSGRRVADALREAGVNVEERDADAALLGVLHEDPPSAVFPLLHGAQGEDDALRDVLELIGVPYVGSRPASCRIAFDKPVARSLAASAGLNVPDGVVLPHSTFREMGASALLGALERRLGLPLVVKPARGGSALGCAVVRESGDLPPAMVGCFAYGEAALVERCVVGTEIAVSVIDTGDGPRALPPVEIVPESGIYDFFARYTAGVTEFFVPARLDSATIDAACVTALAAHTTLGLRDISRTDLIVDDDGAVWFLEVNVAPGMTETSLLPQAARAASLDLGILARDLLELAAARRFT